MKKCYTKNQVLICYCGECRSEPYQLPNDLLEIKKLIKSANSNSQI